MDFTEKNRLRGFAEWIIRCTGREIGLSKYEKCYCSTQKNPYAEFTETGGLRGWDTILQGFSKEMFREIQGFRVIRAQFSNHSRISEQ